MPKIDIDNLKTDSMTGYPEPFRQIVLGRVRKRLGNAAGLTQFGVNLTTLKPGAASGSATGTPPRMNSFTCWPAKWSCAKTAARS